MITMSLLRRLSIRRGKGKANVKFRSDCELPYHKEGEPWYLKSYIESTREKYGEPELVEKPSTAYKFRKEFNVIYPVGGGIFINALSARSESGYTQYIVIEPPRPPEGLLRLAEEEIAALIPEGVIPPSPQEKACLLLDLITQAMPSIMRRAGELARDGIPPEELGKSVTYHVIRDKISVGTLEPFIRDPYLEDISCSGLGNIFIIHKIFGPMESNIGFKDESDLNAFLISLAEKIGKPLSSARPIVDATLPDGSRINIVFGSDVSLRGSNFTIRKVSKTPLSVTQLINWGTFDARVAAYVWMLLREGMSGFVCGETASGKTTSLTAMLVFIRPSAKIVSIEDTAEVIVPHPNWTRELTRDTGKKESSVTMFDLLRAALRQRPNYIIVGEIRGAEGNIAFQAMQSVSWDTPVSVRNTRNEEVTKLPIGEFVDSFYQEGEERIPKDVRGYEVLSFSRDGRLKWAEIKYVLRHRANEIYEVRYEGGGVIRATGSHSVFILDKDRVVIRPKPVAELKPGDLLVTAKQLIGRLGNRRLRHWGWETDLKRDASVEDLLKRAVASASGNVELLVEPCNGVFMRRSGNRVERIRRLLNSDLAFLSVTSVKRKSYSGYVYDISVPETELFIGGEVPIALHNTGHPVLSTFHAADIDKLIQRLTNEPINVPKTNIDSLNFAWFQSAVYTKKGLLARRMIRLYEIIGYDPATDSILAIPVFNWDPTTDRFIFSGRGASYLLEEKIAVMKGIPKSQMKQIYDELELRREFLETMVKMKIFNYWDVWKAVIKADELGVEEALKRLRAGSLL